MKTFNNIKSGLAVLKNRIHEQYGVSSIEMFGSMYAGNSGKTAMSMCWWISTGKYRFWTFRAYRCFFPNSSASRLTSLSGGV